jgi:hypothetical protein
MSGSKLFSSRYVVAAAVAIFVLAGCGTGQPSTSPYSCGTWHDHCYGTTNGPWISSARGHATGITLGMNTLSTDKSGSGDFFFTDETWLTEGPNNIHAWIEAGQIYDHYQGLQYFWAEQTIAPSRDIRQTSFVKHFLGPVTATDSTGSTMVEIRRSTKDPGDTPDTFKIKIWASQSSYSAKTDNYMWTREQDFGYINIGLELAGSHGAFAQPVSMEPIWLDEAGTPQKWTKGTKLAPHPPIFTDWLVAPGPNGAVWLTSCCTKPGSSLGPSTVTRQAALGATAAVRPLAQPRTTTPPPINTPTENPPTEPIGVTSGVGDLVDHPNLIPQAVRDGLLVKIGATSDVTVAGSGCERAAAVAQQLPGDPTAGLDNSRSLCWFKLAGDFGVSAPPAAEHGPRVQRYEAAYIVLDAQTHRMLSAGAFDPVM